MTTTPWPADGPLEGRVMLALDPRPDGREVRVLYPEIPWRCPVGLDFIPPLPAGVRAAHQDQIGFSLLVESGATVYYDGRWRALFAEVRGA